MIKRPLNQRFGPKAQDGIKTTTMREKAWPVGVPIMLYHWEDKPYRSRQVNVCPVVVEEVGCVLISRSKKRGVMNYWFMPVIDLGGRALWECEGFESQADMDDWFRELVEPGCTIKRALMGFKRLGVE